MCNLCFAILLKYRFQESFLGLPEMKANCVSRKQFATGKILAWVRFRSQAYRFDYFGNLPPFLCFVLSQEYRFRLRWHFDSVIIFVGTFSGENSGKLVFANPVFSALA